MNHYFDGDITMEFDIAGFTSHAGAVLGEWLDAAGIDGRLDAREATREQVDGPRCA